jgi:hypothetical protein
MLANPIFSYLFYIRMPAKAHRNYEIIVWALWGKSGDKFKLLMRANSALCLVKISLPGCKVSFPECKAAMFSRSWKLRD